MRQTRHHFDDIDRQVCTFCGACASICPVGVIAVGEERVCLQGECISCGLCYRFCPGREMDFDVMSQVHLGSTPQDPLLGYYRSLGVGQANSEVIRERGSSGGVVTALLTYLLREGQIRGALAVTMSEERAWQCQASLLTTPQEVREAAQSKYSLVGLNALLRQARQEKGPFAVVGLPCHVHGLRRLQELGSFREKFPLVIGLFCGMNLRPTATEYLISKIGFETQEVTHLEYRGGKWPGGFLVQARNGRREFIPKDSYNYVNLMYMPRRCLTCPDLTNELADVSVGDIWLEEYAGGWSTVIGRSSVGEGILSEAALKGVIRLDKISRDDVLRSHAHLFAYKKQGYFVRQRWLQVPLEYSLQRPSIGKIHWLQQSLFLALILTLSNSFIRGLVQRLPLAWLGRLSSWGKKGAKLAAYGRKASGRKVGKFTIEDSAAHWDKMVLEGYDEINVRTDSYVRRFDDGFRMSEIQDGALVLDLGCGTGNGTLYWHERRQLNIVGLDISGEMLRVCAAKLEAAALPSLVLRANGERLPFRDNTFDNIISFEALEHTPNPDLFITEAGRVLKRGGEILITTPNTNWEFIHWLAAVTHLHHSEGPHRFVPREEVRAYLQQAGFRVKREETRVLIPQGPSFLLRWGKWLETQLGERVRRHTALRRIFVCEKL